MLADLTRLLLENPKDYLGTIFMELNLGKHFNGQFSLHPIFANLWQKSHLMMVLRKQLPKRLLLGCRTGVRFRCDGIGNCPMSENRGYKQLGGKLYIEATDIDPLCVSMTFIQLSLLGLSVKVIHGNSLTQEVFETWDSPNLQMANMTGYFS